jgi:hypothetical protein
MSQLLDVPLIIEGRACGCGSSALRVHLADGRSELRCVTCDRRAGLLSDRTTDFILAICRGYGPPEKPIVLRRPQQTNSA